MPKPMVRIIAGDDVVDREMTDTEHSQYLAGQAAAANQIANNIKAVAAQAVARQALLTRLGITETEAKLLFG